MKTFAVSVLLTMMCMTGEAADGVRISFVGDIMTHAQQLEATRASGYDFTPQFEKIAPFLSADLLIGNFETTLPGPQKGYSGFPKFGTPDSLADALSKVGFNVLLLANNHIYDKGADGLLRTIDVLEEKGFSVPGAYKSGDISPLVLDVKGISIGILNYSYGSNVPIRQNDSFHVNIISEDAIVRDIRHLRDGGAKFVIAAFHWGIEYQSKPSASQRKIADACFKAGADLVIGTHPHVLQPIEISDVDGKIRLTAYSLGNFISFQRTYPRERSIILSVEISSDEKGEVQVQKIELAPIYVEMLGGGLVRVVHAEQARRVEEDVLKFLNVSSQKNERSFYTLFP